MKQMYDFACKAGVVTLDGKVMVRYPQNARLLGCKLLCFLL